MILFEEASEEEGEIIAVSFATVEVDLGMQFVFVLLFGPCLNATISTFSGRSPSNEMMSSLGTQKLERQRVNVSALFSVVSMTYLMFFLSSIEASFVWK